VLTGVLMVAVPAFAGDQDKDKDEDAKGTGAVTVVNTPSQPVPVVTLTIQIGNVDSKHYELTKGGVPLSTKAPILGLWCRGFGPRRVHEPPLG
jgi:hypothetical protein